MTERLTAQVYENTQLDNPPSTPDRPIDYVKVDDIVRSNLQLRQRLLDSRPDLSITPEAYLQQQAVARRADLDNGHLEQPDDPRLQLLLLGYIPIVQQVIRTFSVYGMYDRYDLYQMGMEGVLRSLNTYNPQGAILSRTFG